MIGPLFPGHRKAVLAVGALCLCGLLFVALMVVGEGGRHAQPSAGRVYGQRPSRIGAPARAYAPRGGGYHPRYVLPPQTAKQTQLASALAAAESPEQIAAGQALRIPSGHYSASFPPVPRADTADEFSYAKAWVTELLDVHYRSQSRAALLAWAIAGEAADTLPGVPVNVEDKALYASLATPGTGDAAGETPIPNGRVWTGMAARDVAQRASAVEVAVDPAWTRLVGEGFVPNDPLCPSWTSRAPSPPQPDQR